MNNAAPYVQSTLSPLIFRRKSIDTAFCSPSSSRYPCSSNVTTYAIYMPLSANPYLKTSLRQHLLVRVLVHAPEAVLHIPKNEGSPTTKLPWEGAEGAAVALELLDGQLRVLGEAERRADEVHHEEIEGHSHEIDVHRGDLHRPDGTFYARRRARSPLVPRESVQGESPRTICVRSASQRSNYR